MDKNCSDGFKQLLSPNNPLGTHKDFQIGFFIFYEELNITVFRDAQEREVDISRVLFLTKSWDTENWGKDFPKPYIFTKNGELKEYGANVLYTYLNSVDSRIVTFGSIADLSIEQFDSRLNTDFTDASSIQKKYISRNNKKRFFAVNEDAAGNLQIYLKGKEGESEEENGSGNISIKIEGTESNGKLNLVLNGKFAITQTETDSETPIAQILMDNTKDAEKIKIVDKTKNIFEMNKEGVVIETAAIRIGKDETLKKILDDLITAILHLTQSTPAGSTVSPPLNKAEFDLITERLNKFMDKQ